MEPALRLVAIAYGKLEGHLEQQVEVILKFTLQSRLSYALIR